MKSVEEQRRERQTAYEMHEKTFKEKILEISRHIRAYSTDPWELACAYATALHIKQDIDVNVRSCRNRDDKCSCFYYIGEHEPRGIKGIIRYNTTESGENLGIVLTNIYEYGPTIKGNVDIRDVPCEKFIPPCITTLNEICNEERELPKLQPFIFLKTQILQR